MVVNLVGVYPAMIDAMIIRHLLLLDCDCVWLVNNDIYFN